MHHIIDIKTYIHKDRYADRLQGLQEVALLKAKLFGTAVTANL